MTGEKTRLYSRILLWVYLIALFVLCFGKFGQGPDLHFSLWGIPTDKLVHFAMFFPFPILTWLSLDGKSLSRKSRYTAIATLLGAGTLIAIATEAVQYFLPYRNGDWMDLLADIVGLLVSSLILLVAVCRKD